MKYIFYINYNTNKVKQFDQIMDNKLHNLKMQPCITNYILLNTLWADKILNINILHKSIKGTTKWTIMNWTQSETT